MVNGPLEGIVKAICESGARVPAATERLGGDDSFVIGPLKGPSELKGLVTHPNFTPG